MLAINDQTTQRRAPGSNSHLVGVVIPTRNRPAGLRAAVTSVLDQGDPRLEVVVVDEASAPSAAESLGDLAARVVIIRNEVPRGPASARNQGAASLTSDFVAFLDDDDRWLPGKLDAFQATVATVPEASLVVHRTGWMGAEQDGTGRLTLVADPLKRMLASQPPHLDGVVVRRDLHQEVCFDESLPAAEDLDYLVRLAWRAVVVEIDRVFAVHGIADQPSDIRVTTRIAGRRRFATKHAELLRDPRFGAFHYVRLGHLYRQAGQRWPAMGSFVRAIRLQPSSRLAWKGLARAVLPTAVAEALRRSR